MTVAELEDRLWLALRQCATHPAGPLAAVAAAGRALREGELDAPALDDLAARLLRRYEEQPDVLPERVDTVRDFLSILQLPAAAT